LPRARENKAFGESDRACVSNRGGTSFFSTIRYRGSVKDASALLAHLSNRGCWTELDAMMVVRENLQLKGAPRKWSPGVFWLLTVEEPENPTPHDRILALDCSGTVWLVSGRAQHRQWLPLPRGSRWLAARPHRASHPPFSLQLIKPLQGRERSCCLLEQLSLASQSAREPTSTSTTQPLGKRRPFPASRVCPGGCKNGDSPSRCNGERSGGCQLTPSR
jgi:hypothetical protein